MIMLILQTLARGARASTMRRSVRALAFVCLSGCDSGTEPRQPAVVRLDLRPIDGVTKSIIFSIGAQQQLRATAYTAANVVVPGVGVAFVSRAPAVVSVDQNGLARGMAPGQTWVVATVASSNGAVSDSVQFTINEF